VSVFGGTVLVDGGGPSSDGLPVSVRGGDVRDGSAVRGADCVDAVDVELVRSVVSVRAGRGRGGAPGELIDPGVACGSVSASVPGCPPCAPLVATCGSVKLDVVSALVPVIGAGGGATSPGALIVEVTLLA